MKELEECVKELKGLMEAAEKESESKYSALQHQHRDLQVSKAAFAAKSLYLKIGLSSICNWLHCTKKINSLLVVL